MAIVTIDDTNLTNIAGAIREKNGTQDTYKPSEMAAAISAIQAGGSAEVNMVEMTLTGKSSSDGFTPVNLYDYVEDLEDILCIYIRTNVDKSNYMADFCYIKGYGILKRNVSNVDYFSTGDALGVVTNPYFYSYSNATADPTGSTKVPALIVHSTGKINFYSWTGSKWANPSGVATGGSSYMHFWMLYK